jgi:cobalamin biosynthesis protein CobD/CbiB
MTNLRRYYIRILIFSFLLFLAAIVFARLSADWLVSDAYLLFVPFFLGVGILTGFLHKKSLQQKDSNFTQWFMGITMARFFFYLVIMVGYSLLFREDAAKFIVWFMVFYLFYSSFEVLSLFRSVRKRD